MKKLLATLLILVMAFTIALPALADSPAYDVCVAAFNAHKTVSNGTRIDKVLTVDGTTIKYTAITSDAVFVSNMLKKLGLVTTLKTRLELKSMTEEVSAAVDGALLFKYSSSGSVSVVGMYAGGYQFYVKSGYVAMQTYAPSYWDRIGVIG